MLTGELKNKIDSIWEMFWTGGITNPLDVVEQMTYLMFIHDLDEADTKKAKNSVFLEMEHHSMFEGHEQYKWSVFRDLPAEKMYDLMQTEIFPFIKNLHGNKESTYSKYMSDAIFKIPTPQLLSKIVDALDGLYIDMSKQIEADTKGDVYESLLAKLTNAGINGQFRTPRHIIRMMVELLDPKPDDMICDPACGTSGFLVAAGEYLKEKYHNEIMYNREKKEHYNNSMFYGYDMDRTMLRVGAMNMMTHGVDNPNIDYRDSLSEQNTDTNKYSIILANPPFKGSLDADTVSPDLLKVCKTKKTELLFLALFLRMLKVGGRCACIVPDGVLFGSSTAHKAIRKELIENHRLEAVISMPSGVFKPYAGVSTGILIFTNTGHGGTDNVWFYDMQADGFSLDDKRTPISDNDIPDIIERFRNMDGEADRQRTDKSFLVPKDEIVGHDYDLSINKYKKVEYKPVEYPPADELWNDIENLNAEIECSLIELSIKSAEYDNKTRSINSYHIACEFYDAALLIDDNNIGLFPVVMNITFSCELFLKAMLYMQSDSNKKICGHNLLRLFNQLDKEDADTILKNADIFDIDTFWKETENAFSKWRYFYEEKGAIKSISIENVKRMSAAIRTCYEMKYINNSCKE